MVAIGFALAFTVLRVINFAHPDIFMVGMFAGLLPAAQWPALGLGVAVLAGAAGSCLVGFALERTVIAPLRGGAVAELIETGATVETRARLAARIAEAPEGARAFSSAGLLLGCGVLVFLNLDAEIFPGFDILMGKPLPVRSAELFYRQLKGPFDPTRQLQWLIDSPQRLQEYLQLAQGMNTKLRANIEIELYRDRHKHASKNDDDLPIVR